MDLSRMGYVISICEERERRHSEGLRCMKIQLKKSLS